MLSRGNASSPISSDTETRRSLSRRTVCMGNDPPSDACRNSAGVLPGRNGKPMVLSYNRNALSYPRFLAAGGDGGTRCEPHRPSCKPQKILPECRCGSGRRGQRKMVHRRHGAPLSCGFAVIHIHYPVKPRNDATARPQSIMPRSAELCLFHGNSPAIACFECKMRTCLPRFCVAA